MTASRDSAECNAAGQVCVGTAAIAALRPAQLTKKIGFLGAETRTTHITSKRVRDRLKWDEWNGSAENMQLEILPRSIGFCHPVPCIVLA